MLLLEGENAYKISTRVSPSAILSHRLHQIELGKKPKPGFAVLFFMENGAIGSQNVMTGGSSARMCFTHCVE